ncbi:hypothetical protein [Streptomyces sp. CC77]|uniref:hypothetical protein n=1 Tax=Streptomyces sp. CC77 TaxID=1906739 RepID=UPI0008DD9DE7|nr:hypothetical protein [Streptomyces sp. CC77]OII68265.1 hypothetical protein BJP39_00425 [Streptomyces sp. CC77]
MATGLHLAIEDEAIKTVELVSLPGVTLHVDHGAWDYHITVAPDHTPGHLRRILAAARSRGLDLLDQDACVPVLLADDSVRLYLQSVA